MLCLLILGCKVSSNANFAKVEGEIIELCPRGRNKMVGGGKWRRKERGVDVIGH